MDSVSKQPILFCPFALFTNQEDEFHSIQFGESPIISNDVCKKYYSLSFHCRPLDWCNNKEGTYDNFLCKVCMNPLNGTTFYSCKICFGTVSYYHKECIEPISKHPYHPKHTLRLINSYEVCLCCSSTSKWAYNCNICYFTMCQNCAREPPLLEIYHPKRHKHTLFYFPRKSSLICDVCALSDNRSLMYSCGHCDFLVHKECVYFPCIIRISRHEHRLSFNSSITPEKRLCGVCRENIDTNYGRYSCVKDCSYDVHSKCATRKNEWDGKELEGNPEDAYEEIRPFNEISDGVIQHFSHQNHHMRLDEETNRVFDENKHCQACTVPICDDITYNCMQCNFILHQKCAHLPRRKYHPTHPHPLSLQVDHRDNWFKCTACRRKTNGFVYLCYERGCGYELDVRCASIAEPLDHRSHEHPLFLTFNPLGGNSCWICLRTGDHFIDCIKCSFHLCFGCATLPSKMRYKHDIHFFILSYGKGEIRQYLCEACEKEASPKGMYMCRDCDVTLHIQCLLGKDMYMMPSGEIKFGNVNVNILLNNRLTRNICQHCHNRCQGKIVFEVSHIEILCSFNCLSSFNIRLKSLSSFDYDYDGHMEGWTNERREFETLRYIKLRSEFDTLRRQNVLSLNPYLF